MPDLFPPTVTLVDTGERRYPEDWEIYFWYDLKEGQAAGPFVNDPYDRNQWSASPTLYAIYKRAE